MADMRDYAGTTLCVTEKIDGCNVRISRGVATARSADQGSTPWLAMCRKHVAWRTADRMDLILFGEDIYGVHAIEYDPVPEDRTFRLFAVVEDERFQPWDRVEDVASELAIATVPVVFRGRYRDPAELRERLLNLMAGPSALGGEREGLVIRRDRPFGRISFADHVCKMVRSGHVQPDEEHWSKRWRPARTTAPTGLMPAAR